MNFVTPNGIVSLSPAEVSALADSAARYDVLGGFGFNNSPVFNAAEVLAR